MQRVRQADCHMEQEYCHDCSHTHHHYDSGLALWLHRKPVSTSIYQSSITIREVLEPVMPRKWRSNSLCPSEDGSGSDHSDSASSNAKKKKRLQSGGASGIGNWKTVRAPGGEQLADSDKKYSSAEAFKWAGTPK